MKLIIAIIRPERLEAVQYALAEHDLTYMTVSEVRGCGRQRGFTEIFRGTECEIRLVPKLKLEIAIPDVFLDAVLEAVVHAARSSEVLRVGDGKVFLLPLEESVQIRTGEQGPQTLTS